MYKIKLTSYKTIQTAASLNRSIIKYFKVRFNLYICILEVSFNLVSVAVWTVFLAGQWKIVLCYFLAHPVHSVTIVWWAKSHAPFIKPRINQLSFPDKLHTRN